MPVILEDEMLIPPSLRRRNYIERDRCIEVSSNTSTSTIDLPPHRVEYDRPRSPLVIHEDHYIPVAPQEVDIIREREIVIEPAGSARRYYRRSGGGSDMAFGRRGRARSVGYDDYGYSSDSYCSSCDEEVYALEDGSMYGSRRRAAGGGLAAGSLVGGRHRRRRKHEGGLLESHHPIRRAAEAGVAAVGLRREHDHPYHERPEQDPNRRVRHLANAGLGIAAAGAAKELYDARRHRTRSRSSSASPVGGRHTGRHVAAAALGATAAGLAAHEYANRRRGSFSSYSSDDEHGHHRGRKLATAAGIATAAGLAAKAMHDHRHRSRSRSSSDSRGSSRHRHHHLRNAALGLGATTGIAAHHARSRSRSRPGILRHHRRSSSAYSTSSSDSDTSHHKLRNAAALGAGAAGLAAAARHHRNKERSRSRSRPGILRHRSRTHSPPRRRSSSRGAALAKTAAATMVGALAERQHRKHKEQRARSVDAARRRRYRRGSDGAYRRPYGGGFVEDGSVRSDSTIGSRSRRGSGVGRMLKQAFTGNDHAHPHHPGNGTFKNVAAQEMAYRVGEGVADALRARQR